MPPWAKGLVLFPLPVFAGLPPSSTSSSQSACSSAMPSNKPLSMAHLLQLLEEQLLRIPEHNPILTESQTDAISRLTTLTTSPLQGKRDFRRKHARSLRAISGNIALRCSSSAHCTVTPGRLGSLRAANYLQPLIDWWLSKPRHTAMSTLCTRYTEILPPQTDRPANTSSISVSELSDFLCSQHADHDEHLTLLMLHKEDKLLGLLISRGQCQKLLVFVRQRLVQNLGP